MPEVSAAKDAIGIVVSCVVAGCLVACQSKESGTPQHSGMTPSGWEVQNVDVMNFALPADFPMVRRQDPIGAGAVQYRWVHTSAGKVDCLAGASVEAHYTGSIELVRQYMEDTGGGNVVDDPEAPRGVKGIISQTTKPDPENPGRTMTTTIRTWIGSRTKMTLMAKQALGSEKCDTRQIGATMGWNGKESKDRILIAARHARSRQ